MLQGSIQSLICSYVFNLLPIIYKKVCVAKSKPLVVELKKKQPTPGKAFVKCDKCHFKSSMVQMKMHIKNIHMKKATRASKRFPVFTPDVKASKRTKPESILNKVNMINIVNLDDSVLLSHDEPAPFDATSLDEMVIDSITTEDKILPNNMEATQQQDDVLIKCCVCEYEAKDARHIKDHEMTKHGMVKCPKCDNTIYEALLRNHLMENHSENPVNKERDGGVFDLEEEQCMDSKNPDVDAPAFICGQYCR